MHTLHQSKRVSELLQEFNHNQLDVLGVSKVKLN